MGCELGWADVVGNEGRQGVRAGSVDWPEVMMMNGRTADQLDLVCSAAEA